MKKYCRQHDDIDIAVWYNGSTEDKMRYWLIPKSGEDHFMYFFQQPPGGLGEKLREATLSGFRGNREYVVIIGKNKTSNMENYICMDQSNMIISESVQ